MISFIHGWGFDRRFWRGFAATENSQLFDLGFFGEPLFFAMRDKIVCHSYGLIWLLLKRPQSVRSRQTRVVAFNSSPRFGEVIAPRPLARMLDRWRREPTKTLSDFLTSIGAKNDRPALPKDHSHLTQALVELATADCLAAAEALGDRLLLVNSEDDEILPIARIKAQAARRNFRLRLVKSGGHLLPLNDPKECLAAIRTHLQIKKDGG